MPQILAEQIHYNVADMADALDKIRQFAVAQGWVQDYWNHSIGYGDSFLQLWSPGFSLQDMCYRFRENNYDATDDRLECAAVIPGKRFDLQGDPLTDSDTIWSPTNSSYNGARMPATTFTALYLYGNKHFISCIFHVDPIAVVTMQFGTYDLFPSWRNYEGGLFFYYHYGTYSTTSTYSWTNIASNPTRWNWGPGSRQSQYVPNIYWQGAGRFQSDYCCNFRPTNSQNAWDVNQGEFNRPYRMLNNNTFTDKRVAFQPTVFCRDQTLGVWYPIGNMYFSYINGEDFTIGEQVTFGSDTFRVFPIMYSTYDIWQAYRTA